MTDSILKLPKPDHDHNCDDMKDMLLKYMAHCLREFFGLKRPDNESVQCSENDALVNDKDEAFPANQKDLFKSEAVP